MDNHFHIVVETIDGNLSAGMRQLNGVYTQWHNRNHNQVGHVFQGSLAPRANMMEVFNQFTVLPRSLSESQPHRQTDQSLYCFRFASSPACGVMA